MKTFRYRKRSPIGGLAANIAAEAEPAGTTPRRTVQIQEKLWLELPEAPMHWRDVAWMAYGLSLHSADLNALHPRGLVVRVSSFSFPYGDYVPEVAAFAMEGWVRESFNLNAADIDVEYDMENSRYVFFLGGAGFPFSGEASGVPVFHVNPAG